VNAADMFTKDEKLKQFEQSCFYTFWFCSVIPFLISMGIYYVLMFFLRKCQNWWWCCSGDTAAVWNGVSLAEVWWSDRQLWLWFWIWGTYSI